MSTPLTPDDDRYILAAAHDQIVRLRVDIARVRKVTLEEVSIQETVKFWAQESEYAIDLRERARPPSGCENWHYQCRCGASLLFHAADREHAFRILEYRRWVRSWARNAGWPDWFCSHACVIEDLYEEALREDRWRDKAKERP